METMIRYNIVGREELTQPDPEVEECENEIMNYIKQLIADSTDNFYSYYSTIETRKERVSILLNNMLQVHKYAENGLLSQTNYIAAKTSLMETIVDYFGSIEDVKLLEETVDILEANQLIPAGSYEEILMLTPLGRWT